MTTDFVIDGDAGYDPDELPPVPVRIDGVVYEAHCPKDSVGLLVAGLPDQAQHPGELREIISQALHAFLEEEDADEVMDKVLDLGNRRVGLGYVVDLLNKITKHYEPMIKERRKEMGLDEEPEPANRAQRRAAARKPAAKKTAAKRAAARSRS